jgi:hypothetical protein
MQALLLLAPEPAWAHWWQGHPPRLHATPPCSAYAVVQCTNGTRACTYVTCACTCVARACTNMARACTCVARVCTCVARVCTCGVACMFAADISSRHTHVGAYEAHIECCDDTHLGVGLDERAVHAVLSGVQRCQRAASDAVESNAHCVVPWPIKECRRAAGVERVRGHWHWRQSAAYRRVCSSDASSV